MPKDKQLTNRTIAPQLDELNPDDARFWGFGYVPKVSEFDDQFMNNGKT